MKRLLGALVALCLLSAAPVHAYEEDTHFTMTLVLCRAAGFTDAEALIVATYDQGMDDSGGTVANTGPTPHVTEEYSWHAIPERGTKKEVLDRKIALWKGVAAEGDPLRRLQRLGVFFHYQQDSWAHRKHPNSDPVTFTTYSTPLGHLFDGHQPDRPPFDPVCALRCLEEGIIYARSFVENQLQRKPDARFDNYSAAKGELDNSWNDNRKGKSFNTLVIDSSTPARKFFTDLIRSQIDAYTTSLGTADEARYSDTRVKLQGACNRAGLAISIPSGYNHVTNLTTALLQSPTLSLAAPKEPAPVAPDRPNTLSNPRPSQATYTVKVYTGDKTSAGTDSNIYLTLVGTRGQLTEVNLNKRIPGYAGVNAFERNQTDTATLKDMTFIGELTGVTVRSDNSYAAPGWFLGWIEISSPGITTRRFDFNAWVESPNLSRTVSIASTPTIQQKIKIKSASNGQYLCASDGLQHDKWLYCKPGTPLTFMVEGNLDSCSLRVDGTNLYFSYTDATGAVKLWNTPERAQFKLERQSNGAYALKNIHYNQYVWLSKESPYITRSGNAGAATGQWRIEGLQ